MAHLVAADHAQLSSDDMDALFAYLRHGAHGAEPEPVHRGRDDCMHCGGYVLLDVETADNVCEACGVVQPWKFYEGDSAEDMERIDTYIREGYKPIHHWHERIAQYHLQESPIQSADWVRILDGLLQAKPAELSKESLRRVLRSVKLQRFNENWLQIIHRLTGYVPPRISQEEQMVLDACFEGLAEPFKHFKPTGRKNLLNYNFLLYRLLQIIGRHDCLPHFPQLKTWPKWLQLDDTWRRICEYQDWEHVPYDQRQQQWLSIPTCDAVWARAAELRAKAAKDPPPAPKRKRVHSHASRVILYDQQRRRQRHEQAVSNAADAKRLCRHPKAAAKGSVKTQLRKRCAAATQQKKKKLTALKRSAAAKGGSARP